MAAVAPDLAWDTLADGLRSEHVAALADVARCSPTIADVATWLSGEEGLGSERGFRSRALEDRLGARSLYDLLRSFSHNTRSDIANSLLGPVRVLALHATGGDRRYLHDFLDSADEAALGASRLLDDLNRRCSHAATAGALDRRVRYALDVILGLLAESRGDLDLSKLAALAQEVMEAFAECRTAAGEAMPDPTVFREDAPTTSDAVVSKGDHGDLPFRVLVIDDHAKAWRPVFECVAAALTDHPAVFEFSTDAGKVTCAVGTQWDLAAAIAEYDAVVLDVFIGAEDVLALLKRIRQQFTGLPVFLWTSSLDPRIVASAAWPIRFF